MIMKNENDVQNDSDELIENVYSLMNNNRCIPQQKWIFLRELAGRVNSKKINK